MHSMTYGKLPSFEEFEQRFDIECPDGTYNISLGSSDSRALDGFRLGDGAWTVSRLYRAIQEVVAKADIDAPAMDVVSSILTTLGFEWI